MDSPSVRDGDGVSERNGNNKEHNHETELLSTTNNKEMTTTTTTDGEKMNELETKEEKRQRMWSIRIIHFTMFLMTLGFSIVLTGVYPYLDKLDSSAGKEFMGYVVASNSLGQMIFSPMIGWWSTKVGSVRSPLIWTIVLFTIASGWYSILELFAVAQRRYWMLITRLLVGISSANVVVARAYISDATTIHERTREMSWLSLAQVLGFVFGPILQMAVTPLGETGINMGFPGLTMDMYTAAGWLNVPLGLINLILLHPKYFVERKIAIKEAMLAQGYTNEKETWKAWKPDFLAAWTLIIAFFIFTFNFVLLETLGTLLTMEQYAWTKEEAITYMGLIMTVGAVIAFAIFAIIKYLCEKFGERWVLIIGGFGLMVLGRFAHIPMGSDTAPIGRMVNGTMGLGCPETQEWCLYTPALTFTQFIIGYMLTSAGYPLGITLIQSIFSKILGPRPQGVWMGLMTGSGCLSRVLGPVFVSLIYTTMGTSWTFGLTAAMMTFFTVWMFIFRNRFIIPESALEKALKDNKNKENRNVIIAHEDEEQQQQSVKLLNDNNGMPKVIIIPTNHKRQELNGDVK